MQQASTSKNCPIHWHVLDWDRQDFIKFVIGQIHGDLRPGDTMFAGKFDRLLGMPKIMSLPGICGPISQAPQVELRAGVLQ
jgi:hypothetical protein